MSYPASHVRYALTLLRYRFEASDASGKLVRTEQKIKQLSSQLQERQTAERSLAKEIDDVKGQIATAGNVESNIRANQLYRSKQRKMKETKAALEELDVSAAAKAHRRFNEDFEAGRQIVANKNAAVSSCQKQFSGAPELITADMQLSRLGGEVETLKKQSEDITEQLNEEYKNVKSEYRNQLIKVKVSFLNWHF